MGLAPPRDIVAALKDYRLDVVERPGWTERGSRSKRTGQRYPFNPYGQAWHHDAFQQAFSDLAAVQFMEKGRPDLPPYLCNGTIGAFSTVYLVCYGNANHAGRNEADVHARLKAGKAPLGDARLDPDGDTVVGNPHLWGWECRNAGTGHDVWEQLDAMERAGAAMCDVNGWPPEANAAHRELTARKPDPAGIDMRLFRADIARILAAHRAPPPIEEDLVSFVHITDLKRFYALMPDGVVRLTDEQAFELGAGGVKWIEMTDATFQVLHSGPRRVSFVDAPTIG